MIIELKSGELLSLVKRPSGFYCVEGTDTVVAPADSSRWAACNKVMAKSDVTFATEHMGRPAIGFESTCYTLYPRCIRVDDRLLIFDKSKGMEPIDFTGKVRCVSY